MTTGKTVEALVVATFRRRMDVRLPDGTEVSARIKGRRLRPVCGDEIVVEPLHNEHEWLITAVLPRRNQLMRPNLRGGIEILAANVTLLVAVAADPPKPDWFIVDRYLCAAEIMQISAAVVYNKVDLLADADALHRTLGEYRRIGYAAIETSAETGTNLDSLAALLKGEIGIVVGQSGVGKSSIINQLTSDAKLRVAEVSSASGEGKHTTVNSSMLRLPGGGAVIDSPGVRDYAPAIESLDQVVSGFKEILLQGQNCKFANCRHLREPHCAVKAAVESDEISARRYESYKRLYRLTEELVQARRG